MYTVLEIHAGSGYISLEHDKLALVVKRFGSSYTRSGQLRLRY